MTAASSRAAPWTFVLDEPVRVLVVDDDPILREFASVHLSTPCATIDTACDVASARTQLRNNDYDIILLDIEMPGARRSLVCSAKSASSDRHKHLPVIMLTGHDDIASIDRAYQIGANSFATKPVNWRQLSYQVRYVVRMSGRRAADPRDEVRHVAKRCSRVAAIGSSPGRHAPGPAPPARSRAARDAVAGTRWSGGSSGAPGQGRNLDAPR